MNFLKFNVIFLELMRFSTPTGHFEHSLGLLWSPSLLFEKFRVQIRIVVTQMVTA